MASRELPEVSRRVWGSSARARGRWRGLCLAVGGMMTGMTSGCAGVPAGQAAAGPLSLAFEVPTRAADGLTLTLVAVEDSRCPEGVQCIWAGRVEARVKVRQGADDQEIILSAPPRAGQERAIVGYQVEVLRVSPYPSAKKPPKPQEYTVEVRLEPDSP